MSGNKLLNENTIRRFMKLANTEYLSDTFFEGVGRYTGSPMHKLEQKIKAEKDPVEKAKLQKQLEDMKKQVEAEEAKKKKTQQEGTYTDKDDSPLREQEAPEEEPAMDEPAAEEDEDMDMEMDMGDEPDDDMGAADISLTEEEASLLIDLGERLKEAMGDEEDMDMDDEPEMDMDDEPEMPEDDAGADMEDEPGMRSEPVYENQDEIVQEVLRRVTKRIVAEKLKNK